MRAARTRFLCLVFMLMFTAAVAAAGSAQTVATGSVIEEAAAALRRDSVYVHPEADPGLSEAEADRLRQEIVSAGAGPVYVAVLPETARREAGGGVDDLLKAVVETVGRSGTYAVVVDHEFRAGSSTLPAGTVPAIADDAVARNRGQGPAAVLFTFVRLLEGASRSPHRVPPGGAVSDAVHDPTGVSDPESAGSGPGLVAVIVATGAGGLLLLSLRRRHRGARRRQQEMEEVRREAFEDLVALGEDLRTLDLDVEMPSAAPEAKTHYERALGCYERASADLDRARRPDDLRAVSEVLEEGRYEITCVRARLEGRDPPARRPPCFFDPRHGQSVRDVRWAPTAGIARSVPACEADAQRVEQGEEPTPREVQVGGRRVPYWEAPYHYGPWAAGHFGGFGLLEGLLLGSIFTPSHHEHGLEPSGLTGDFGGGDFGGGDFGGGDFGGGDFGGGDFGG